jgi:D-alanyl-D-alanine carboxypeptidase
VTTLLQEAVEANVLPGAVVVVRDGDQVSVVARGMADTSEQRRLRASDRFPFASVTKPMVAALVLQLVDEGRLELGDPVERWLPSLVPSGGRITLEHLLSHRSGLPESASDPFRPTGSLHPRQIIEALPRGPLAYPPGSQTTYRNVNFIILGLVIERVTGQPLAVTMSRRVFEPLGMATSSLTRRRHDGPHVVHGYDGSTDMTAYDVGSGWSAAGGAVGTAGDVDRFFRGLLTGRLFPARLVEVMARPQPNSSLDLVIWGYGLGLAELETDCGDVVGHNGGMPGFQTAAWTDRSTGRSLVVLANTDIGPSAGRSTPSARQRSAGKPSRCRLDTDLAAIRVTPAAPVPAWLPRLPDPDPSRPRRHRPGAQRTPSTDPRLQDTIASGGRGVAWTA